MDGNLEGGILLGGWGVALEVSELKMSSFPV